MQRAPWLLSLALVALPLTAGCDLVTAQESARSEWTKSYTLADNGRVEIDNVNGRIEVEAWDGNTVEVRAERIGKGTTPDAAKRMLDRIEILEQVTPAQVRLETKVARATGWLGGGAEVRYVVKVPAGAEIDVETVNGGIEVSGVRGPVTAETTNGGVTARRIAGPIDASTTNGGVDVDVDEVAERGIELGLHERRHHPAAAEGLEGDALGAHHQRRHRRRRPRSRARPDRPRAAASKGD